MNNFKVLLKGELDRMQKYHILGASVLVSLIWVAVMHFTAIENVDYIFPLLLFFDATMMAMLMVGVTMFFEKQEGTLKTLLVSPISKVEYILAKSMANVLSSIISLVILYAYAWFFKDLSVNLIGIFAAVFLIAFFHALFGFILMYNTRDFTSLLMGIMAYAFIVMIPVVLNEIGVLTGDIVEKALYILPTKASSTLLFATTGVGETWEIVFSACYLLVAIAVLYHIVKSKFDEFAVKESGV